MEPLGSFEITYFQCRPTSDVPERKRDRAFGTLVTEFGWTEQPLGDLYDTAAVDSQLLRRFDITGLALDASQADGWLDCGFGPPEVRATALFANFGFVVIGITLAWDNAPHLAATATEPVAVGSTLADSVASATTVSDPAAAGASWYARLGALALDFAERDPSTFARSNRATRWRFNAFAHHGWPSTALNVTGSVRSAMDLVGYVTHEALISGGRLDTRRAEKRAEQIRGSCTSPSVPTCAALHQAGELRAPDVHTWGFHANFIACDEAGTTEGQRATKAAALDAAKLAIDLERVLTLPRTNLTWPFGEVAATDAWRLRDKESTRCELADTRSAAAAGRAQRERAACREFVEYLALRRGFVMALQRMVTREAASNRSISHQAMARWSLELSIIANDYLLSGFAVERMREPRRSTGALALSGCSPRSFVRWERLPGGTCDAPGRCVRL